MKINSIIIISLVVLFTSCNKQKTSDDFNKDVTQSTEADNAEGLKLFQQNVMLAIALPQNPTMRLLLRQ
jgi:hypothetical protein